MSYYRCLLKREVRALLWSPATYAAGGLFLLLMGIVYISIIQDFSNRPHENVPMTHFFNGFWLPVLFLVPLITMRSFAEERRLGTLEAILTTGVTPTQLVLAKFTASYVFYMLLWTLTLSFPLITYWVLPVKSMDTRLFDLASIVGGWLFVAMSGLLHISIGILTSSLTRSQLVAGMFAFTGLFVCIVGSRVLLDANILELPFLTSKHLTLNYFQTFQHLEDCTRGVLDTRPFFLYASGAVFCLTTTALVVELKA